MKSILTIIVHWLLGIRRRRSGFHYILHLTQLRQIYGLCLRGVACPIFYFILFSFLVSVFVGAFVWLCGQLCFALFPFKLYTLLSQICCVALTIIGHHHNCSSTATTTVHKRCNEVDTRNPLSSLHIIR